VGTRNEKGTRRHPETGQLRSGSGTWASRTRRIFNTELLNAWELGNMLEVAEVVAQCAVNRQESRGGHSREDFPKRDDQNWLRHTLAWQRNGKVEIGYKPVVITKYAPKERVIDAPAGFGFQAAARNDTPVAGDRHRCR
jgi:succinate dehydrogenase/fumarate reductase flavoprotein subunit